jgi:hypothetical protein
MADGVFKAKYKVRLLESASESSSRKARRNRSDVEPWEEDDHNVSKKQNIGLSSLARLPFRLLEDKTWPTT